jgi:hypothetical protein
MKKKIITGPHFTRKPLCKIKMCHAEGMGENEMFVLKVAIRKWGEVVLRYYNWVNTVQYYKPQHQCGAIHKLGKLHTYSLNGAKPFLRS